MMMSETVNQSLGNLRTKLARVQTDLATGRRLHKPSDHPSATVDALRVKSALERLDRYDRNLSDATGWLSSTDSALDHLNGVMVRAYEVAVRGANGTEPQDALNSLAEEVDALLGAAVDAANSTYAETYLFGGLKGDQKPFTLAGGIVTYNGDAGAVFREIAPGTQMQVNVSGSELQTVTDLFNTLKDLADRLRAGDHAGISSTTLQNLQNGITGLVQIRASVGARQRQVEIMEQRSRDLRVNMESHLEVLEGIDMERTIIDFNQMDMAYRTALQVGGRILPPSLLDFLR